MSDDVLLVTVSPRSRFGFAWTNQPTQTPTGLAVLPPSKPQWSNLGVKQLRRRYQEAARTNNGNDWACAVFVRGLRVRKPAHTNAVDYVLSKAREPWASDGLVAVEPKA